MRVSVSKAFGILRDPRAVKPLIGLLDDRNGFVVPTTIESLSRIGGEEARSSLLRMLSSRDTEIRRTTIKALSQFNKIEDHLIPFLHDDDWATRMAVVDVLGKTKKKSILMELEKLLDTEEDPIVKKAIAESLRKST